jgi:coproporphyrinogen III oxidase-like Fe-S oxidoreductase
VVWCFKKNTPAPELARQRDASHRAHWVVDAIKNWNDPASRANSESALTIIQPVSFQNKKIEVFVLRMNAGWPFAEFQRATNFELPREWESEMKQLVERGWASRGEDHFGLTPQGLRFADAAAEMFLR